jgi:hypothetical protein
MCCSPCVSCDTNWLVVFFFNEKLSAMRGHRGGGGHTPRGHSTPRPPVAAATSMTTVRPVHIGNGRSVVIQQQQQQSPSAAASSTSRAIVPTPSSTDVSAPVDPADPRTWTWQFILRSAKYVIVHCSFHLRHCR